MIMYLKMHFILTTKCVYFLVVFFSNLANYPAKVCNKGNNPETTPHLFAEHLNK